LAIFQTKNAKPPEHQKHLVGDGQFSVYEQDGLYKPVQSLVFSLPLHVQFFYFPLHGNSFGKKKSFMHEKVKPKSTKGRKR